MSSLSHEETGFLVSPGDSQALASRIRWVYQHREAAKAMGLKGRRDGQARVLAGGDDFDNSECVC